MSKRKHFDPGVKGKNSSKVKEQGRGEAAWYDLADQSGFPADMTQWIDEQLQTMEA